MIEKRNLCKLNLIYSKVNNDFLNKDQLNEKEDLWFYEVTEKNTSKNDFANRITEDIDLSKDDFKNFEPLFNAIRCIISNIDEKMAIKDDMY